MILPDLMKRSRLITLGLCLAGSLSLQAAALTATVPAPLPAETGYFKLGATRSPDGHELSVNSRSLLFDGQPWFPVMGEFHYSRYPENEWRDELLKLKAGGVDIVASYVFWIHHEEIQGQFDWSGQRDLRKFVQLCGDLGLKVIVRCGPWCHGEVRNGGLPDWVQAHDKKDWKLRSTDTNFLAAVTVLYGQIAKQLNGLFWKDGGPVIGIQLDNEHHGSPAYLLALKKIAIAAGLDAPFYTKTGWPVNSSPMPLGEMLPLFGTYADGAWDRDLVMMGGEKWTRFAFSKQRTDAAIASDLLGDRRAGDEPNVEKYPRLTCEIGAGMEQSYHRRILIVPRDIESVILAQLGSGVSLLGYYMYHGGQNPDGKLTTLNESQASGYPNDMPVKNYDYQAPLGEYGQINPQYHWLRRLHLFLHDFGGPLAQMPVSLPDVRPTNKTDLATLRWAVRSDGQRGFVFVNNYQRLQPMPAQKDVQFKMNLPGGEFVFPEKPVTIPSDAFFIWPFNLDLDGAKLIYATAQPVCRVEDTFFFAETPGVKAEFIFDPESLASSPAVFRHVKPGREIAIQLQTKSGKPIQIVLLNDADSLALWKGKYAGSERVVLSPAGLVFDGGTLKVTSENPRNLQAEVFPGWQKSAKRDGIFSRLDLSQPKAVALKAEVKPLKPAGPAREIPLSTGRSHIALAPVESDFTNAAIWKITLPADLDLSRDPILRIRYAGDIARVTLNGKLIDDNFYIGKPFDLGLKRYAPEILTGDLRLEILPLRKDAPIYLADEAKPDFGKSESIAKVNKVEIINRYEAESTAAVR
jgi:beta-galactosidase